MNAARGALARIGQGLTVLPLAPWRRPIAAGSLLLASPDTPMGPGDQETMLGASTPEAADERHEEAAADHIGPEADQGDPADKRDRGDHGDHADRADPKRLAKRPRKYVPAEAYRFLVLSFLRARGDARASKGEIAWNVRANHYMVTRVLKDLRDKGYIDVFGSPAEGFAIALSVKGEDFYDEHRAYFIETFGQLVAAHYRFGKHPDWLPPGVMDTA